MIPVGRGKNVCHKQQKGYKVIYIRRDIGGELEQINYNSICFNYKFFYSIMSSLRAIHEKDFVDSALLFAISRPNVDEFIQFN